MADIHIYNVAFDENSVLVTYSEERDQTEFVAMQRTLVISNEVIGELLLDALDTLQDMVDKALVAQQNPQARRARRSDVNAPIRGD